MIRPSPERGDVVPYDFTRPSRISPDRQRNLQASHEQLAQALQRWVSGRLRAPFEVHLESVDQASYGDFVGSLPDPGATFLYDIVASPGMSIAVCFDPQIAYLLIERLLGGGSVSPAPERPLSQLESVVMRIVTDRVAKEVAGVWKDHLELELQFARFESARELIEMTARDDDVLVTTLQVEMDEMKGVIQFVLPFPVLESFLSPTHSARVTPPTKSPSERASERNRIEAMVRRAAVVVSARLPDGRSSLAQLSNLGPGDVLELEASASDLIDLHVAGKLRFKARQGRLGPHLGVQITEILNPD